MKFKNLDEIQKHLEIVSPAILIGDDVRNVLAEEMQYSIDRVVYGHYKPRYYKRRFESGGLSDKRNMQWTLSKSVGNTVHLKFENLTVGQTRQLPIFGMPQDSLDGYVITDVIEEGGDYLDWYLEGKWSKPRPFIRETIQSIKSNPRSLINGVKAAYRKDGYHVK